jgi:hypothetical protein
LALELSKLHRGLTSLAKSSRLILLSSLGLSIVRHATQTSKARKLPPISKQITFDNCSILTSSIVTDYWFESDWREPLVQKLLACFGDGWPLEAMTCWHSAADSKDTAHVFLVIRPQTTFLMTPKKEGRHQSSENILRKCEETKERKLRMIFPVARHGRFFLLFCFAFAICLPSSRISLIKLWNLLLLLSTSTR